VVGLLIGAVCLASCAPVMLSSRSTTPPPPQTDGTSSGYTYSAYVNANYCYACTNGGLQIIDITDPSNSNVLTTFALPDSFEPLEMQMSGSTAFVTCSSYSDVDSGNTITVYVASSLLSIDMTSPLHPTVVGDISATGENLRMANGLLYLASPFQIIDVSNPSDMKVVFRNGSDSSVDLAIHGNYAYVCNGSLEVYDISNPSSTHLVHSVPLLHPSDGVFHCCYFDDASGYLFALQPSGENNSGDPLSTLRVFDLSDPEAPTDVEDLQDTANVTSNLFVNGNYAFFVGLLNSSVTSREMNVCQVLPLGQSDSKFYYCGASVTEFNTGSLARSGDYIYIPNGEEGLEIYKINVKANSGSKAFGTSNVLTTRVARVKP